jgi:hypothetical protein
LDRRVLRVLRVLYTLHLHRTARVRVGRPWQGAPKKKKKNDVPTYLLFLRFFEIFWSDFRKYFYGVFGLLMQRNGQKRDKKN